MKKFMKISFFKKIAAAVSVLSVLILPIQTKAGLNDVFKGWAWTPNIGWISMNSTNTIQQANPTNSYGVTVDDSGNVFGWAWSSNIGWICFGVSCAGYGTSPDGSAAWAQFDTATPPQLHGWARIKSQYDDAPTTDAGWISLNCNSTGSHPARNICSASNYSVYLDTTSGQLHGYVWNCTTTDGSSCSGGNYTGGLGWIRFDVDYSPPPNQLPGTFGGVPWVQVLYGDLYAKGSISTPSPFAEQFDQVNATYCIDTGVGSTVQHFAQGENCASGTVMTNINLPKRASYYSNSLGRIRLRGYDSQLQPLDSTGLAAGKYGPWSQISDLNASIPDTAGLGGKIFDTGSYGDWTMNAHDFYNSASGSGAGLIIVRGNLTIAGDITYHSDAISKLQQLASVGILVLDNGSGTYGNVVIDPLVETVSANIYAEGTIATGTGGDPTTEAPLTINGVVVSRQFNFQRVFPGSVSTPSEKIVYDGRIVANTPPGLSDFAASLPAVSY
jgi:hypothetical protein